MRTFLLTTVVALMILGLAASSCTDDEPADGDGDGDADGDADGDGDGDGDADADGDSDIDADIDADRDADEAVDAEADVDGDIAADSDAPAPILGGIWISPEEIMSLPMSGPAWDSLLAAADSDAGTPNLSDQDQDNNVLIMAKALVYVRTGEERYRTAVRQACMDAIGTEAGGRTLALGRELAAYVISADLVGLEADEDASFREFLTTVRNAELDGMTLISTHETRPNNWGTMAGASRVAIAVYLGDTDDLERAAQVFHGYLGARAIYSSFRYDDDLTWQADPDNPVGVNPAGSTSAVDGESIDGAMPEEMRRGCSYQWPPCETGYPWEGLQGVLVLAEILHRRGYDTWNWQDRAILRAVQFLYDLDTRYPGQEWAAAGDDEWQTWLINLRYGTDYTAVEGARSGKIVGWTDWTHAPVG